MGVMRTRSLVDEVFCTFYGHAWNVPPADPGAEIEEVVDPASARFRLPEPSREQRRYLASLLNPTRVCLRCGLEELNR